MLLGEQDLVLQLEMSCLSHHICRQIQNILFMGIVSIFRHVTCLGSSVGKSVAKQADGCGFESHPRQLFSLPWVSCVVLLCLSVVLCCLAFLSKHLMDD